MAKVLRFEGSERVVRFRERRKGDTMTLVNFVTQFWVLLLSFAVMIAVLAIAVGVRAAWKERQEQPIKMDEAQRQRLEERLLQVSAPHRRTA